MGVMTKATNSKFLYNRINKLNAEIDELKKEIEILQKENSELRFIVGKMVCDSNNMEGQPYAR